MVTNIGKGNFISTPYTIEFIIHLKLKIKSIFIYYIKVMTFFSIQISSYNKYHSLVERIKVKCQQIIELIIINVLKILHLSVLTINYLFE